MSKDTPLHSAAAPGKSQGRSSPKNSPINLVVTGGGSGIGYEIAKRWLRGADPQGPERRVVLVGKEDPVLKTAVQELLKESPRREGTEDYVRAFACDLRDEKAIRSLGARLASEVGEIYGLVNNAGTYPFGQLANTTVKDWNDTLSINLTAAFLMTQMLAPLMAKAKRGRVIMVSSTAGILPNHFALAYSVSKAALIQLSKTLAKELVKDGITVNCICPGIVRSPMHEGYHANTVELETFYAKKGAQFPVGRVGEPRDVANAADFLLREESDWVTGEVMVVDGGRLLL